MAEDSAQPGAPPLRLLVSDAGAQQHAVSGCRTTLAPLWHHAGSSLAPRWHHAGSHLREISRANSTRSHVARCKTGHGQRTWHLLAHMPRWRDPGCPGAYQAAHCLGSRVHYAPGAPSHLRATISIASGLLRLEELPAAACGSSCLVGGAPTGAPRALNGPSGPALPRKAIHPRYLAARAACVRCRVFVAGLDPSRRTTLRCRPPTTLTLPSHQPHRCVATHPASSEHQVRGRSTSAVALRSPLSQQAQPAQSQSPAATRHVQSISSSPSSPPVAL